MPPTPAPVARTTGSAVDRVDPWKEDGNIVLAAEGKYFRVHRSILSAHSEVFKDMFDCVHSNSVEKELVELCPVIHLHDAATDVQIMLKALYDRSYPVPYYEKMPISFVAVFLHLGDKYAISALVKEAKARLCCPYKPTLSATTSFMTPPYDSNLFPRITDGDPYNFQVMNLLREMDLIGPLPLAMYHCILTCPLTDIVDGHRVNGSICSLSPANLRSFIRMKDVLEQFRVRLAKSLYALSTCTRCTQNVHRLWSEDITAVAPFRSWPYAWDKLFCEGCKGSLKGKHETERIHAWDQLPATFGFDSWADVAKSGDFPSLTICTY